MELSTPALLFSTISLLLLAYTNRFLALASLIRHLHAQYREEPKRDLLKQIKNLKVRVRLIRDMQAVGILSLLLCVAAMFSLFQEERVIAQYLFGSSLVFLLISLGLSGAEIFLSTKALNIQLQDLEDKG